MRRPKYFGAAKILMPAEFISTEQIKSNRVEPPTGDETQKEKAKKIKIFFAFSFWYAVRDSNPRPSGP